MQGSKENPRERAQERKLEREIPLVKEISSKRTLESRERTLGREPKTENQRV